MSTLEEMMKRTELAGGSRYGRMVKGKLESMRAAAYHSYQGEWITIGDKMWRCLINPEKLTTDYDQKIISIEFEAGLKPGDTFYWNRTGKHWIVYNEHEEEEAYFRARIRKCEYQIDTGNGKYWVWMRGPVETALVWRQKHKIEMNDLNYSIEIFVEKNEDTQAFFTRHNKVKFDGHTWKVATVDRYSQEGLLEVYLEEYFDNTLDDAVEVPEVYKPDETIPYIEGPALVQAFDTDISYSIVNYEGNGAFVVNSSKAKITSADNKSCVVTITSGKSGKFDLIYKIDGQDDIIMPVIIDSF